MSFYFQKRTSIIFLLLVYSFLGYTQSLTFTKFRQDDFVSTIFQDKIGFLWLGTPGGLYRYDGYHFKGFLNNPKDSLSIGDNNIWAIVEDKEGYIWVGTVNGLNRFDPKKETFTRYNRGLSNPEGLTNGDINDLLSDTAGTVWVATANGLNRYIPETKAFKHYFFSSDTLLRPSRSPIQTRDGRIWVGVHDTLYHFDPDTDSFSGVRMPGNLEDANYIRLIYEDQEGMLWIGTRMNGVFRFSPKEGAFLAHFSNDLANRNSLSNNKISAFIQNGDQLWIGTTGGGLNILDLKSQQITRHTGSPPSPSGVNSETIRDAWEDNRGNIWLGSYYDGLYQFKNGQRIFRNFDQNSGLTSKKVNDIEETSDGKIWLAMGTGGIAVFNTEENKFTDYFSNEDGNTNGLPKGDLKKMRIDIEGNLWLASTSRGISRLDLASGNFQKILPQSSADLAYVDPLNDFLVEENGDIWLAKQDGLIKYINASQSFKTYHLPINDEVNFKHGSNNFINSIYRDRKGQLWFASYGGINLYDREKDALVFFPLQYQVLSLFEDHEGRLIASTTGGAGNYFFDQKKRVFSNANFKEPITPGLIDKKGRLWAYNSAKVFRHDPTSESWVSINQEDGLAGNLYWTVHLAQNGQLLLGGTEGLTIFHPDSLKEVEPSPRVVLTDFQIFNQSVPIRASIGDTLDWESPLINGIAYTKNISLKHWQNYFSIEFAALDLTAPAVNKYQYKLEGYDKVWTLTNADRRFVTYTNLSPGTYTFQVKGATKKSPWSQETASLTISILPPWWRTWWAYGAYLIIAFSMIYTFQRYELSRKLAKAEAQRQRKFSDLQTQLYTNITHEFRTPLTVILGLAEQMKRQVSESVKYNLNIIIRNGGQLLTLVNQLLDLSKIEAGQLSVKNKQGDIVAYLKYLFESFQSLAAQKRIDLHFESNIEVLQMDFDPYHLMQIINNLLSNAIKFTPEQGNVFFRIQKTAHNNLSILIEDSGIGIPEDKIPKIFDRFYQVDNTDTRVEGGTGIGLTLTKELIELMQGEIRVESVAGQKSIFTILLPIRNKAESLIIQERLPQASYGKSVRPQLAKMTGSSSKKPRILIVEDNADVIHYMTSILAKDYQLEVAFNGLEGLEKAMQLIPDLILTDLMMPQQNGYELCRKLKTQALSSHIPIIMLTAKADTASRLTGFKKGADDYLTKPFLPEELHVRINNLLQQRKRLMAYYQKSIGMPFNGKVSIGEHEINVPEDLFLKDLNELIEEHLQNPDLDVTLLESKLLVSQSSLYRKVKALTDLSPQQYIRTYRLGRATKLLSTTKLSISEIAYETGFRDPDYFTRVFKKEQGVTPTTYRNKHKM